MRATKLATKIHKWLALIVGIQIILWFASGLFMAHFPIEKVRGEDQMREAAPATFAPAQVSRQIAAALPPGLAGVSRIEVRPVLGQPVLQLDWPDGRPQLFDAATGRRLSPLPAAMAVELARADYAGEGKPRGAVLVDEKSTEYRGALPAWRVDFEDSRDTSIYVAADTAKVTARRTDLWRTYDFLWGLHIMDWKNHEDFNSWWLWLASLVALIGGMAGMVMMPNSLKATFRRMRRRRQR